MMTRISSLVIAEQSFDLAVGSRGEGAKVEPAAILARVGTDIYDRPVAVEVDLESEMQAIGNLAMVEALLLLLAQAIQDRDAVKAALQKGAGFDL